MKIAESLLIKEGSRVEQPEVPKLPRKSQSYPISTECLSDEERGSMWWLRRKQGKSLEKRQTGGAYTITVRDRSVDHHFRLRGPRMNKLITSPPFTGTKTVTVTLRKGRYTYLCDPHEFGGMKGTFRLTQFRR